MNIYTLDGIVTGRQDFGRDAIAGKIFSVGSNANPRTAVGGTLITDYRAGTFTGGKALDLKTLEGTIAKLADSYGLRWFPSRDIGQNYKLFENTHLTSKFLEAVYLTDAKVNLPVAIIFPDLFAVQDRLADERVNGVPLYDALKNLSLPAPQEAPAASVLADRSGNSTLWELIAYGITHVERGQKRFPIPRNIIRLMGRDLTVIVANPSPDSPNDLVAYRTVDFINVILHGMPRKERVPVRLNSLARILDDSGRLNLEVKIARQVSWVDEGAPVYHYLYVNNGLLSIDMVSAPIDERMIIPRKEVLRAIVPVEPMPLAV